MGRYLGYVIVLCGLCILLFGEEAEVLLSASVVMFLGVAIFIYHEYSIQDFRKNLLLILYSAFFLVVYPLSGICVVLIPETINHMLPSDFATYRLSLLCASLGWFFLALGFTYATSISNKRDVYGPEPVAESYSWPIAFVVSVMGLGLRLFVAATFFSESFAEFYSEAGTIPSVLANFGLMCVFVLSCAPSHRWRAVSLVMLVCYSASGLLTGQRADMFVPLIMYAFFRLLLSNKLSLPKATIYATAAFAMLVLLFPLLTTLKVTMQDLRQQSAGVERLKSVEEAWKGMDDDGSAQDLEDSVVSLLRRYSHLQYGGQIVTRGVSEWGYQYGMSVLMGVYAFVPRLIWPDKPEIGFGPLAYQMMGYKEGGSATVPVVADWFLNFGWLGVIAGMFITGLLASLVNRLLTRDDDLLSFALLSYLSFHYMQAGQGISNAIAQFLIGFAGLKALRLLVRRRRLTVMSSDISEGFDCEEISR